MSYTESIVFAMVLTGAVGMFLFSATRLAGKIALGRPDARLAGEFGKRFWTMLVYAFGQKRVRAERFGINHFLLFWGFLTLFFANAEFVVGGLFPSLGFFRLGVLYGPISLAFDLVYLVVLGCVVAALYRRLVVKPSYIDYKSREAFLILGLVGGLMLAFYGMHGAEFAGGHARPHSWMPVSRVAAVFFSAEGAHAWARVFWWLHAGFFLFFLNYLPYSKHMHILTAIPNCYCRAFEPVRTVPREQYARGAALGVSRIDQFTWKDLLDFTACTECGRCNANCPATTSGKALNPRHLIHDGKVNLLANGDKLRLGNRVEGIAPLIGADDKAEGTIGVDALWSCTTCGACMANCPVFIEHVPKIIQMRRHLVESGAEFPEELKVFFEAVEQRSNPWGIAPSDRAKWAKELGVPLASDGKPDGKPFDYLFYVGCAGAFDARNKKVAVSVVRALQAAGVSFAILGNEEKCCGDSMRRLGNEFVFEKMAKENVALLKKYGVSKIIAYCPHCYTTLKHDYAQYGLTAEVVHHSEFLAGLVAQGKLRLSGGNGHGRVVWHDSCYLGRYNGITQAPRDLIRAATGHAPLEMDRVGDKSFCCGAGGGRMWMEEEPEHRVNTLRVREALAKQPDTIAVSCPYCMTMFEDGVKDEKAGDAVKVMDIAELVAEKIATT
jgi:Fe-S oxidoreductase